MAARKSTSQNRKNIDERIAQASRDTLIDERMQHIDSRLTNIELMSKTLVGGMPNLQFDIAALHEWKHAMNEWRDKQPSDERVKRLEGIIYGGMKVIGVSFLLAVCAVVWKTAS